MPITPPVKVSITDSTRNCVVISFFFAPIALRKPDLARALGDGRKHHVHDADAADEERYAGDGGKKRREGARDARRRGDDVRLVQHAEIGLRRIGNVMPLRAKDS